MAQMGFFDLSDRYASPDAKKYPLVEQVWRRPESARKSRAGRRTLVLGALCNLSDDQILPDPGPTVIHVLPGRRLPRNLREGGFQADSMRNWAASVLRSSSR